jgi:hypothetical protein
MAEDRHRCRWHTESPAGRCPNPQAFPGAQDVPELCMAHLHALEPWIASRPAQRADSAPAWIDWARRHSVRAESEQRALGEAPPLARAPSGVRRNTMTARPQRT